MSEKPISRQEFLRKSWRGILGFAGELLSGAVDTIEKVTPRRIRPPGAVDFGEFLVRCTRCQSCIKACPFFALRKVMDAESIDHGTPHILPKISHCRWCEGFPCIQACPSRALIGNPGVGPSPLALAVVDSTRCLRTSGTNCRSCAGHCPKGIDALTIPLEEGIPEVFQGKCVGCGACEAACPVQPFAAIRCELL